MIAGDSRLIMFARYDESNEPSSSFPIKPSAGKNFVAKITKIVVKMTPITMPSAPPAKLFITPRKGIMEMKS